MLRTLKLQMVAAGYYALINNKTKGIIWTYGPTFYGIPEENEDMVWLSYWKFGDELKVGDEVEVSAQMPSGFYVKECGIRVVYEQEEKGDESNNRRVAESDSFWYQNIADRDLYPYQLVHQKRRRSLLYAYIIPENCRS